MEEKIFTMQKKIPDPNLIAFMFFGHPFNGLKKFQNMAHESFLLLLRKTPPPKKKKKRFFTVQGPHILLRKNLGSSIFLPTPPSNLNNDCKKILTAFT